MKLLPCRSKRACSGPALASRNPDVPQMVGTMHDPRLTYMCARCGLPSTINSIDFNALPRATVDQLLAPGLPYTYADFADPANLDLIGDLSPSFPLTTPRS